MRIIRSTITVLIDTMTYPSKHLPSVFAIDPLHPDVQHMVKGRFRLITCDQPEISRWKDDADALIVRGSSIAPEDLAQCKRLRWVQKHGVGVDQLDIGALKNANVGLMNTPGANVSEETG
jgi:D-3-phosphoglycerate dehydrogenase